MAHNEGVEEGQLTRPHSVQHSVAIVMCMVEPFNVKSFDLVMFAQDLARMLNLQPHDISVSFDGNLLEVHAQVSAASSEDAHAIVASLREDQHILEESLRVQLRGPPTLSYRVNFARTPPLRSQNDVESSREGGGVLLTALVATGCTLLPLLIAVVAVLVWRRSHRLLTNVTERPAEPVVATPVRNEQLPVEFATAVVLTGSHTQSNTSTISSRDPVIGAAIHQTEMQADLFLGAQPTHHATAATCTEKV